MKKIDEGKVDIRKLLEEDNNFPLNLKKQKDELHSIFKEANINKKVPFILFLDSNDTASMKYVSYKSKDLEGTNIEPLLVDISEFYLNENLNETRSSIKGQLECIISKYEFGLIPYIVQIPSSNEVFSLFKEYDIESEVSKIVDEISHSAEFDFHLNFVEVDYLLEDSSRNTKLEMSKISRFSMGNTDELMEVLMESKLPATPKGILILMLYMSQYDERCLFRRSSTRNFCGLRVALVGCNSKTTGKYLKEILPDLKSTVTLYHSLSDIDLDEFKKFNIIISCVGKAGFINRKHLGKTDWDRLCIDTGVSLTPTNKLSGDFNEDIRGLNGIYFTPYIGGVGLLTRSTLLCNIIKMYKKLLRVV
ncbi:MAG: hypothetical protein ACRCX2_20205 [Paraclostridium sp.]